MLLLMNKMNPIANERKWGHDRDRHLFSYEQNEPYRISSLSSLTSSSNKGEEQF